MQNVWGHAKRKEGSVILPAGMGSAGGEGITSVASGAFAADAHQLHKEGFHKLPMR